MLNRSKIVKIVITGSKRKCSHIQSPSLPDIKCKNSAHDVMKLIFAVLYVSLNDGPYTLLYKSSSGDEIPERDLTYHLLCLLVYH